MDIRQAARATCTQCVDKWAVRHDDSWMCYISVKVREVFDNSLECNWHLPLVMQNKLHCKLRPRQHVSRTLNTITLQEWNAIGMGRTFRRMHKPQHAVVWIQRSCIDFTSARMQASRRTETLSDRHTYYTAVRGLEHWICWTKIMAKKDDWYTHQITEWKVNFTNVPWFMNTISRLKLLHYESTQFDNQAPQTTHKELSKSNHRFVLVRVHLENPSMTLLPLRCCHQSMRDAYHQHKESRLLDWNKTLFLVVDK